MTFSSRQIWDSDPADFKPRTWHARRLVGNGSSSDVNQNAGTGTPGYNGITTGPTQNSFTYSPPSSTPSGENLTWFQRRKKLRQDVLNRQSNPRGYSTIPR